MQKSHCILWPHYRSHVKIRFMFVEQGGQHLFFISNPSACKFSAC
jgi:hypothetical protein